jgi:hypothetical protein
VCARVVLGDGGGPGNVRTQGLSGRRTHHPTIRDDEAAPALAAWGPHVMLDMPSILAGDEAHVRIHSWSCCFRPPIPNQAVGNWHRHVGHSIFWSIHRKRQSRWNKWSHGANMYWRRSCTSMAS